MTAAVQRLAPGVPFGEGLNLTAEMMATRRAEKAPAREAIDERNSCILGD